MGEIAPAQDEGIRKEAKVARTNAGGKENVVRMLAENMVRVKYQDLPLNASSSPELGH